MQLGKASKCQAPGCRPASPSRTKDHRNGLFGTIQGYEAGSPSLDSWMGNALVDPKKGKLGLQPPPDPKGGPRLRRSHPALWGSPEHAAMQLTSFNRLRLLTATDGGGLSRGRHSNACGARKPEEVDKLPTSCCVRAAT